jgi:NAD(P)-dependent dehydrogenase (short-subunit alcohol dehydrogenase family)
MTTRTALVTGAARGLGVEIARQLHRAGTRVVLGVRDPAKAEALARELGGARVATLDMADAASIDACAAALAGEGVAIDVLINNAGIHYDMHQRATNADWGIVREAFEVNLFGPWRLAQRLAPGMRARRWGRIVNVSSQAGSLATMGAGTPAYSASKAALNAMTITLASELKGSGVLVNAVCPGWTATDMGGGGRPVPEGAKSVVWAALLPDNGPTAGFFRDGQALPW